MWKLILCSIWQQANNDEERWKKTLSTNEVVNSGKSRLFEQTTFRMHRARAHTHTLTHSFTRTHIHRIARMARNSRMCKCRAFSVWAWTHTAFEYQCNVAGWLVVSKYQSWSIVDITANHFIFTKRKLVFCSGTCFLFAFSSDFCCLYRVLQLTFICFGMCILYLFFDSLPVYASCVCACVFYVCEFQT